MMQQYGGQVQTKRACRILSSENIRQEHNATIDKKAMSEENRLFHFNFQKPIRQMIGLKNKKTASTSNSKQPLCEAATNLIDQTLQTSNLIG